MAIGTNLAVYALTSKTMNVFSKKGPSPFIQLPPTGLDCPNSECEGWLVLFGIPTLPKPTPVYFQCSNKKSVECKCSLPTIFSKKQGHCEVCDSIINEKDIITQAWDRKWIHFRCAHRSVKPADTFAVCLRCEQNISTVDDSQASRSGGVEGFVHKHCAKKKRHLDEEVTDGEFGSQESV